jgi:hypothetical protein
MHALVVLVVLFSSLAWAADQCSHYASPTGTGAACTQAQPCRVSSWWPLAGPGTTLCLQDGVYTGEQSMILPPGTVRGTASQPVTIRAEHDGQVLLDAQHGTWAVLTSDGNAYLTVEGINASNGYEALYRIRGSHITLRRVIGWNGTSGMSDSNIFRITGTNNRVEDCAAWGSDSRKLFDGAQNDNAGTSGFRRCWGEWNDHPQGGSGPNVTYQVGYNTSNQLYENVIGTWDSTGDGGDAEAVLGIFHNAQGEPNSLAGTRILGSLFYARPGAHFAPGWLVQSAGASGVVMRDVAAILGPGVGGKRPFVFGGCGGGGAACVNNTCTNCLSVHDGLPSVNQSGSGWTLPQWHEGRGLAEATGGVSVYTLLPGLCTRFVDGVLTSEALWPWAMNERIKEARLASGRPLVDVTALMEAAFGVIPKSCSAGGTSGGETPPPEPTPGPHPSMSCIGELKDKGLIELACTPQQTQR